MRPLHSLRSRSTLLFSLALSLTLFSLFLFTRSGAEGEAAPRAATPTPKPRPPARIYSSTVPATNPEALGLVVDDRQVLGWIAGTRDRAGESVIVKLDGQERRVRVRLDNTFVVPYVVAKSVDAEVRLGDLVERVTLHPRKALEPTVFFVVDRTAYRPEQAVRFAGFLRKIDETGEWAAIARQPVEVSIVSDRKRTVAGKIRLTSDDAGKIAGEYTFSKEDPIDGYTISIAGYRGSAQVTLGEQRKSKVRLKIDGAPSGKAMKLSFAAVDFLDKPVDGATVRFTAQVVRDLDERPAGGALVAEDFAYYRPAMAVPEPSKLTEDSLLLRAAGFSHVVPVPRVPAVLAETSGEIAAPGTHEVHVRDEWRRGSHRLLVEAILVDRHGREQRASRSIPLANPSRRIDLSLASMLQATDVPVEVAQTIESDSPVTSSSLIVMRIQPESFGHYAYPWNDWNHDYDHWNGSTLPPPALRTGAGGHHRRRWRRTLAAPDESLVTSVPFSDGIARVELDEPGAYRLISVAQLADGTSLFGSIGCAVREPEDLPPLAIRLDRDTLRAGERLTGTIESRFADARVLLTIRDSRGTRMAEPMRLRSDGTLPIDVPLPDDLRWGASVTVDHFETAEKRHVAHAQFHVTPTHRMITVTTSRRAEVAPGEIVDLDIHVDRREPVDLVVSVYDQSLLGIAPDRSRDVRSFYLADDRIAAIQARDWLRRRLGDLRLSDLGITGPQQITTSSLAELLQRAGIKASSFGYWNDWRVDGKPEDRLIDLIDRTAHQMRLVIRLLHDEAILAAEHELTVAHVQALHLVQLGRGRGEFQARGDSFGWASGNASFSASGQASWSYLPTAIVVDGDPISDGVRRDFSDSAYWNASLRTDATGRAKVSFRVPDSLTNWQVIVTAVSRDLHVGQQRTSFRTTKPIMIWPMLPAQFTEGDEVQVFALVHNLTGEARAQRVSLEVKGGEVVGAASREVVVPARGHLPVYWRIRPGAPGFVELVMRTSGQAGSDASLKRLPVAASAGEQTVAVSGFAEGKRTLTLPDDVDPRLASLDITFAPSVASDMLDSLDYLVDYPYGCVEQTMSRFLPALRVSQILDKLAIEHKELRNKLPGVMDAGVKRLLELQQPDGGWGWNGTSQTHEMMTPYALWGLLLASEAGYEIPNEAAVDRGLARLLSYIQTMGEAQTSDRMFSIYVYARKHGVEPSWWTFIREQHERKRLSDYALALSLELAVTRGKDDLADDLARSLRGRAVRSGGGAHWRTAGFSRWGDDPHEVTAVALKALVAQDAGHPLIAEVLSWLAETKNGNRWNSTKDTAMILFALSDWLEKTGARRGGATQVAFSVDDDPQQTIALRGDRVHKLTLPVADRETTIAFTRGSSGVMMRAVLRYARRGRDLAPVDEGVRVTRRYWLLGKDGEREREIQAGDTVPRGSYLVSEVSAEIVGQNLSRYVLVEDPRPSSCEVIPSDDPRFAKVRSTAYVLREDRTAGVSYHHEQTRGRIVDQTVLHAELAGDFVVPPASVELMYRTRTRGHSGSFSFQVAE